VHVGAIPAGLTAAGRSLWVTTTIDPTRHRGGTLRLVGADTGILDPVYLGGIGAYWLLNGTYDGLVSFRHVSGAEGTVVVPDLATAIPDPTNGRRTYVFRLRDGVRWSTGKPLTVFDVRRGLERFIATGYGSMGQEIVGATGCSPSKCDISGIVVDPAAHSVTITLVRPNPGFLGQLATGGVAAPASTPLTEQKTHPIPATGPYQVARYVAGKLLVLTRNRFFHEWSAAAQPAGFPDRIEWQIDPTADAKKEVDAVAAGHADWADARFSVAIGALESRFGSRVHVTPTETTHGLMLNTRIAPFNDVRARRALAFAIDRAAVVAHWQADATVTCQVLPLAFPGHRPYCPYTVRPDVTGAWTQFDLAKAQHLVAASHTRGMSVTVWSLPNTSPGIRDVVSALRTLGYHARLAIYNHPNGDYFGYIADSRHKVQAGFFGWVADNPSASNFFDPLFTCNGFKPGNPLNPNAAEFCDPSIDRLIHDAEHLESTSTTAASDAWAKVDRRIVDAAAWIPLVNPSWVDVVSTRVRHYERSVVLGMFFDQMWVR
jgi:peptide/nickel transport system substrate-binding protein